MASVRSIQLSKNSEGDMPSVLINHHASDAVRSQILVAVGPTDMGWLVSSQDSWKIWPLMP